jgi:hypothetical protein
VRRFVIGGAAKSGTSALADLVGQHPDLHVCPRKEAHHHLFRGRPPAFTGPGDDTFARLVVHDPAEWQGLIDDARRQGSQAFGDASVYYLYRPEVWAQIADELGPDARVVLILRDPVARIESAWGHLVRDGRETLDLEAALAAEDERVARGWEWCWHLRRVSRYDEQLPAVLDAFGRDRVHVADHQQLRTDPTGLARDLHRFLGVTPTSGVAARQVNPSGAVRNRRLHRFLTRPHRVKDALRPLVPDALVQATYRTLMARNLDALAPPSPELRASLARELVPVAEAVHDLVGLDTSRWCRADPPIGTDAGDRVSRPR